jgi:hypothetical protein
MSSETRMALVLPGPPRGRNTAKTKDSASQSRSRIAKAMAAPTAGATANRTLDRNRRGLTLAMAARAAAAAQAAERAAEPPISGQKTPVQSAGALSPSTKREQMSVKDHD